MAGSPRCRLDLVRVELVRVVPSHTDSVDEIAWPSEGPERGPGRLFKKNRQFLAKPAEICYCFSESLQASSHFSWTTPDQQVEKRELKRRLTN